MKRRKFALAILSASSIPLAGCSGLNPLNSDSDEENENQGPTETEPDTSNENSEGADNESDTDNSEDESDNSDTDSEATGTSFDSETATGDILLRVSDLSGGYEYSGEEQIITEELESEEQEQYTSQNIVRQHSRSFRQSDGSSGPEIVYAEAAIYETTDDVSSQLTETESTFQNRSAEVETIELSTGVTALKIAYESDRGLQNTLIYYQQKNLLLLLIVSGVDEFYSERARELIVKMVSDV